MGALINFPQIETGAIDSEKGPRLLVGAASPLWLMFGGAAMAGAAWWWWAGRWREAVNVEALMALPSEPVEPVALLPFPEPTAAAIESDALPEPEPELAAAPEPELTPEPEAPSALAEEAAESLVETATGGFDEAPAPEEIFVKPPLEVLAKAADDLTRLVGIGPKLAVALAERGVTRFDQIAAWTAGDLAKVDVDLSLKGRALRDAWVAQAKRFAAESEQA